MDTSLLKLNLVTDRNLSKGRDIEWIVREAVEGGVTLVQLREKNCSTKEFVEIAVRLKRLLSSFNIPLIVNDRVDVALASDADGVHIGQSDMPYGIARKLLGYNKLIGLSVESLRQVEEANELEVDYIGVSPVFGTSTKTDTAEPFGLEGLAKAVALSRHPVVGIGGINIDTAADVINKGADGIAVVSAIVSAPSPRHAAMQLRQVVESHIKKSI